MKSALIFQHGIPTATLTERPDTAWQIDYLPDYTGPAISLTLPTQKKTWLFPRFPEVFEGLLPEGSQLESILRRHKIDRHDYFKLLMVVGNDLVGSLTFQETSHPQSPFHSNARTSPTEEGAPE